MINAFGGPENFYSRFYITAVSPLGLIKHGKNINYYDDKLLQQSIKPFVIDCIEQQLKWVHKPVAFCLGEGKNFTYLSKINSEQKFFDTIVPLPHPRFIMQYKLKTKPQYIQKYVDVLQSIN